MEARRREQQRRRDSAKSKAVHSLPSTQEKEFNIRLIDLYAKYPCLWNQTLKEFEDVELKRQTWQKITDEMGAHLNSLFLRSRLNHMRQQFNIYKLQMINYKMKPLGSREPEKPYYFDKLAMILEMEQHELEGDKLDDGIDLGTNSSNMSISSIVKERIQQQRDVHNLSHQMQRFGQNNEAKQSPRASSQEFTAASLDSSSTDDPERLMGIPTVIKKRLMEKYNMVRKNQTLPTSMTSLSQLPSRMRAQPGDSVSKTKVTRQQLKPLDLDESQAMSEDEEFHRLHLIVRQQGRPLRQFGNARSHLLGMPSTSLYNVYK